jgi:hypothetical protein
MNEFTEIAWRQALKAKGRDWVRAELQKRPGQPQDPVYDIVFEEPLPTRDFCHQWCAEEENRLFHMSWYTWVVLVALFLTVCCCFAAIRGVTSYQAQTSAVASGGVAAPRQTSSGPPPNEEPDANSTGANRAGQSESGQALPDICAYKTYETDECKQPQN